MTTSTPHLALPLIAAAQAQKHVTHNEALTALDALVHLAVLDRDRTTPPGSSAEGDRHIVAAPGAAAWAGKDGQIAAWQDGAWRFYPPQRGWLAYNLVDGALLAWSGSAWADALSVIAETLTPARIGLGTAADAANPFSAKLNDALWTARAVGEGGSGSLRNKFSKESSAGVLSLLFQTGFSGRAEFGLVGDDDFRIKVSPDGTGWADALRIDRASGVVSFPAGAAVAAGLRNLIINGSFAVNQRSLSGTVTLAAGAYGRDRWKAGAGGCTYTSAPSGNSTVITVTAGSLMQVIEGASVEGGVYALSHRGTAQARIAVNNLATSGAYATASSTTPRLSATATGGQNITVEFSTGTIDRVQLEPGLLATAFERRPIGTEISLCKRYYEKMQVFRRFKAASASEYDGYVATFEEKRVTPTPTLLSQPSSLNATSGTVFVLDTNSLSFEVLSAGAGDAYVRQIIALASEI